MPNFRSIVSTTLALAVACAAVGAQELPPPEIPKQPAKPKEEPKRAPAPVRQQQAPPPKPAEPEETILLMTCDVACSVSIDGEFVTEIEAEALVKVPVGEGQHILTVTGLDGDTRHQEIIDVGRGGQMIVQVELASTSAEAFDEAAAEIWLAMQDLDAAADYAKTKLSKSFGFHDQSVAVAVYAAHQALERARAKLAPLTPSEDRELAFEDITRTGDVADQFVELMTGAISSAQGSNSWLGGPQDLYAQAMALRPTMQWSRDTMNTLRQSPAFANSLPAAARAKAGVAGDPRDFDFGASAFQHDPTRLAGVTKGGIADRLGLKSGDRILAANGQGVSSLWELKLIVRQSAGRSVSIAIERGSKRREEGGTVPSNLPTPRG